MSIINSGAGVPRTPLTVIGALLLTSVAAPETFAQSSASVLLEEIVVTARKREEGLQTVPLSVTAYGSNQLETLKIRNLGDLSVGIPNVAMDDVGTVGGTANFSIRGLGINSSIPSIDPTVGTFVNGVYLGTNAGVIFDMFDLESVEVLRGPQGVLFGRNVTGGAVLLKTKKPGEELEASVRAAVDGGGDGGLNHYLMGSIGGPVSDTVGVKVAAYYNEDQGYFENQNTGKDFGAIEQTMIRPVLVWSPNERTELALTYEYVNIDGDGPAGQSHTNDSGIPGSPVNHDRDSFDFSINTEGYNETETHLFIAELNWDLGDNGTVTNIFGYRDLEQDALTDLDAQPISLFDARFQVESEQISNELRFSQRLGDRVDLTTGLYYFRNDIKYGEARRLLGVATPDGSPASTQDGGGEYEVETYAAFAAMDYDLNTQWTLSVGLRYTYEEKSVDVASLSANVNAPCSVIDGTCPYDFVDSEDWSSLSPKIGAVYNISDAARVYAHWVRGFRSGGYNLRNTALDIGSGPFDEEQVDNFEIGFKSEFEFGRLNASLFYNEIQDMQREVVLSDPISGIVQIIRNTADAEILGLELEGVFRLTDSLLLNTSIGWLDADYTEVFFDLSGDGVIDGQDKNLDLPRAAELTYSVGLNHDLDIGGWGVMSSRISYSFRDESAFADNNLGRIDERDILDAGIDFQPNDGDWVISLYGRNLLNTVKHGGDGQLPATLGPLPLGGTFAPLGKGRVIGVEATYYY